MNKLTYFERINWMHNKSEIEIQDVIEIIRKGSLMIDDRTSLKQSLQEVTEKIQRSPQGTDIQSFKFQYLPAVSFNGVYEQNGIVQYSCFTAIDYDHIPSQEMFTKLWQKLTITSCVYCIFRSPSGKGLKAIIQHDNTNPQEHGKLYQQLIDMFSLQELKVDTKNKDLSRRTYLCYDPNVWVNPNPIAYHYQPIQTVKTYSYTPTSNYTDTTISDSSVMYILKGKCKRFHKEYFIEGNRRDGVFWFGTQASKAGVDYSFGLEFVKNLYHSNEIKLIRGGSFPDSEIEENFKNGYDKNTYEESFRASFNSKNG